MLLYEYVSVKFPLYEAEESESRSSTMMRCVYLFKMMQHSKHSSMKGLIIDKKKKNVIQADTFLIKQNYDIFYSDPTVNDIGYSTGICRI
jgi:hypothetical protein